MIGRRAVVRAGRAPAWCSAVSSALLVACATNSNAPKHPTQQAELAIAAPTPEATAPPPAPSCASRLTAEQSFVADDESLRAPGAPPTLFEDVRNSAYQYSRLFGSEFSQRICSAFERDRWQLPIVAVHGDAHLLQFVVTQNSFGLEDFDRSGFGPSVVDIVRYSVSLELACREVSFACDPDAGTRAFIEAYRAALDHPVNDVPTPAVVGRLRKEVPDEHAWLAWADSLMLPLSPEDQQRVEDSLPAFVEQQLAVRPDRPASFYQIVKAGRLSMGVGSGLERKLLFRITGPSPDPDDDVIVEARTTTKHDPCNCVWWPTHGRSFQAMMFMSLLGRRMPELFGYGDYGSGSERQEYWVQAWDPGYRELRLRDIESQSELVELARDAATQLAGHFWKGYPEPLRPQQRFAQLHALNLVEARVPGLARQLAAELVSAWERFREHVARASSQQP